MGLYLSAFFIVDYMSVKVEFGIIGNVLGLVEYCKFRIVLKIGGVKGSKVCYIEC